MRWIRSRLRTECRPMVALAWPVILAELGWMGMGVVDTLFVGRLGAEAIGAVSVGNAIYFAVAIFGMGLLLGLDPLISQAYGADRLDECRGWMIQAVYLGAVLSPIFMGLLFAMVPWLSRIGVHPAVLDQAIPFLKAVTWGTLPLFLYAALRRYLQAVGLVKPVMFALVSANLVNVIGDWALIYGHWGFPALGVAGAGWATLFSRIYMAAILIGYAVYHEFSQGTRLRQVLIRPHLGQIGRLLAIGLPAALHLSLEVGVFAAATALAAMLDPVDLAAHHIVLDVASVTYMIPLGLASAGAVRVGQALGRRQPTAASNAGWAAVALGAGFMALAGTVMASLPHGLASLFTTDPAVITTAATLMLVAAAFQLFDGLQGVSTGTMRGAGDTHTPMICNLVAHWVIGLPLGYLLGFTAGYGILGLWVGLAFGLAASGIYLLRAWWLKAQALARGEFTLAAEGDPA